MTELPPGVRLSVLDRSLTRQGEHPAEALRHAVAFARDAQAWGYHRFWVAEHHSVPGIAGSAPTVLAAAVAAVTDTIRVGTGGVMLPNHQPLVVAEQFGVLEALYPGRIDLGVGRSVGFTDGIRAALGRGKDAAEDFPAQLGELLGYFSGDQDAHPGVHARPAEGLRPAPFVLATGEGAAHAAAAGVPLVVAAAIGEDRMMAVIDRYRELFRPSMWSSHPYVVVAGTVAVAETEEAAHDLLLPEAWASAYSRTRGTFPPLIPAAEVRGLTITARERDLLDAALRDQIHGTADKVEAELARVLARTGADEFLVTTGAHDREGRLDSYRRLAELASIAPRTTQPA
ncbi:MsnO8 family LLM class oxidoreductase [Embleya sp. NBC_00896]|uniref:MsnO8 family LLM class oxidoreductase n=1 Tax=Embleya sp. NBC_00896 TaxID=2975961 RepID=UPI002F91A6D8|nr:MsnO8 family LLM class oxidoreductase [Embleya sp. NBC_00896]